MLNFKQKLLTARKITVNFRNYKYVYVFFIGLVNITKLFFLLRKLNEVRKRLNELRELVHYYEQTSDMMTDAVNENTKEEEETEESESDSERGDPQPVTNIRLS